MDALTASKEKLNETERSQALASKASLSNLFSSFGRYAGLGFLSSLLVAVGSLQSASPFTSKVVGSWWIGIPSPLSAPSKKYQVPAELMVYAGLVLGIYVWVRLVKKVRQNPGTSLRVFWYMAAIWMVPLALAGPLFSKDIYSYAALGEMVSHHISPYQYGPNVLGGTPYLTTVDPFWGNARTPYGPFFLGLASLITTFTAHHAFATMIGLRLLALAGGIGIAIYAPLLASSFGFDKGLSFTLAVLNPVTIYHLVSAGHNDVVMLALLLAGLYYAKVSRPIVGIILVTLAALVKVPAELGVLYIGWLWLGDDKPFKERVRPVVSAFLISAIVMELIARITGLGWGWVFALTTPGTVRSPAVPTTAVASFVYHLTHFVGLPIHLGFLLTITRVLGFALSGLGVLYFLYRSRNYGALKAIGYTFLVVTLFAPVIQPWYIAWGLILLAGAPSEKVTWGIVAVSIAAMLLGIPDGPPIIAWMFYVLASASAVLYLATKFGLTSKKRLSPLWERLPITTHSA